MISFIDRWLLGGRKRRAAIAVGIEAGVFHECPVCRDVTDTMQPALLTEADAVAEEWLMQGDERVRVFRHDEAGLKRQIRQVIETSEVSCTCESIG